MIVDIYVKMPDKKGEMKGGWAVKKIYVVLVAALFFTSAAYAKEYAIIKDTMFGSQKIEIYQTLKEALDNYTGEGKLYEITLKAGAREEGGDQEEGGSVRVQMDRGREDGQDREKRQG